MKQAYRTIVSVFTEDRAFCLTFLSLGSPWHIVGQRKPPRMESRLLAQTREQPNGTITDNLSLDGAFISAKAWDGLPNAALLTEGTQTLKKLESELQRFSDGINAALQY